jgi:hypothetical protein
MRKVIGLALPVFGAAVLLMVANPSSLWGGVPEIDPSSGVSALALLASSVVVIRGLRKK